MHLAIIDYLQLWNMNKKLERYSKIYLLGKNGDGLSAINPKAYAARFTKFMKEFVIGIA